MSDVMLMALFSALPVRCKVAVWPRRRLVAVMPVTGSGSQLKAPPQAVNKAVQAAIKTTFEIIFST